MLSSVGGVELSEAVALCGIPDDSVGKIRESTPLSLEPTQKCKRRLPSLPLPVSLGSCGEAVLGCKSSGVSV